MPVCKTSDAPVEFTSSISISIYQQAGRILCTVCVAGNLDSQRSLVQQQQVQCQKLLIIITIEGEKYLKMRLLMTILIVLRVLCKVSASQPAYQVALHIHLHPRGPSVQLCNGVIVQSRLVLTTATCVHYQFMPDTAPMLIHPKLLSIVAGGTDAFNEAAIFTVTAININRQFNLTTSSNDLALLHLSTSLPLGERDDIKWIVLDSYDEAKRNHCFVNFYAANDSLNRGIGYNRVQRLKTFNNEECTKLLQHKHARKQGICAQYTPTEGIDCGNNTTAQHYTGDSNRGTGIVCSGHLVALLSTILPSINDRNCSEVATLKAYYTNVVDHLGWIYSFIAQEENIDRAQGKSTHSAPYRAESTGAILAVSLAASTESVMRLPAPTLSSTDLTSPITTPLAQHAPTLQAHRLASGCSSVQCGGSVIIFIILVSILRACLMHKIEANIVQFVGTK